MKKLFTLLAILTLSVTFAYSQIRLNVQAGINSSNITKQNENRTDKTGFRAGVGINYFITNYFSVDPSLLIVSKGFIQHFYENEFPLNPIYLQVPICATLYIPIVKHVKIMISAGPYLAYGIGGKAKVEGRNVEDFFGDTNRDLFSKKYFFSRETFFNRLDVGMTGGFGVSVRNFSLLFASELGFGRINTDLNGEEYHHNKNINLTLAYSFRLHKQ